MRYLSTRDPLAAPSTRSFAEVVLAGLAEDGGLYVPERMPDLSSGITGLAGLPYSEIAARIVSSFAGTHSRRGNCRGLPPRPTTSSATLR